MLEPLEGNKALLLTELRTIDSVFSGMAEDRKNAKDDKDPETDSFYRRADNSIAALNRTTDLKDDEFIHWAEVKGKNISVHADPISVAKQLNEHVFSKRTPVIMTSATIATEGTVDFFRKRMGLLGGALKTLPTSTLVLPSPFDYGTHAALYCPAHLPEPKAREYQQMAAEEIAALINLAKGRTFVLFTSHRAMNEVHGLLRQRLEKAKYQVLLQGQKSKGALVRDFRERSSVLFATQSFWEGVDIQGDMLSMVIIDKLPFASIGDPITTARMKHIDDHGGSSFHDYQIPAAAILLKQGFGRLIRSHTDKGVVAILDSRIVTKGYGDRFLESLPPAPLLTEFSEVKRWWQEIIGTTVA